MITLNASGGSVTFTFSGNSTYLNDGTITVPQNSLALIIDESNMATFRKAASNDIFVSANIAEFGMTKDELMAWYKANMVGSTGGGGGVTSGEVQTMIDEAVSGKQDTLIFDDTLKYNKVDDDKLGVYVKIAGGLYGNKKMYGNDTATLDIATIFAPRYANLNFNSSYTGTFDGTNALVVTYYDRNEGEESTSSITWDYSNGNYTTTASTSLVQLATNPNYLNVYFLDSAYRIVKIEHKGLIASLYNQDEAGYYLNSVEFPVDYDDLNSFVKNVLARLTALENNS